STKHRSLHDALPICTANTEYRKYPVAARMTSDAETLSLKRRDLKRLKAMLLSSGPEDGVDGDGRRRSSGTSGAQVYAIGGIGGYLVDRIRVFVDRPAHVQRGITADARSN